MSTVTLAAHYDGKQIVLDEPFDLPLNASLLVTLIPPAANAGNDDINWISVAENTLVRAYSDQEPEYSLADIKHP